jgi:oligopeptide/dipeptide ABC transporter ATP-binding protein
METILEVQGLVKHFPLPGSRAKVQAVNNISFCISKGETLALVGESGSGKTTVGRCVLGLLEATEGSIRFRGGEMGKRRHVRTPELRGRMQLVFQEPAEALDPRIRIGESIEEPLRAVNLPPAERGERVAEVVDRVGLTVEILDQYPLTLSAGQQQRVGIARAIITKPELIVLDEPTSALDPTARAEIIDLLLRLQQELGSAYLFISHDLSAVRYISRRIAVMYLGMIIEQGDAAEVFRTPRHPYSIGLLSSVLLPDPSLKRLTSISLRGEIPSPINLPKGCYLASRCPFADDRCRREMPPAEDLGGNHVVRCFKHQEVAQTERAADTFEEFQRTAERILSA